MAQQHKEEVGEGGRGRRNSPRIARINTESFCNNSVTTHVIRGKIKILIVAFLLLSFYFYLLSLFMNCRPECGACCIATSISSPIPGMPDGKPAGVRCIHLLEDYKCALWGNHLRPQVCSDFKAEPEFCGKNREEAMRILALLDDTPTPFL